MLSAPSAELTKTLGLGPAKTAQLIAVMELARRTLTETSVFPREIVRQAMHHNAAAVIFAHNHPSGIATPSSADEHLTDALKQALNLIDVKLLDHFIVAGLADPFAFSEHGKLSQTP